MRHSAAIGRATAFAVAALVAFAVAPAAFASQRGGATTSALTVTITDKTLSLSPARAEAGTATLRVLNKGTKSHVLTLAGPGIKRTRAVPAGGTVSLTLQLRSGAYVLSMGTSLVPSAEHWLVVTPATAPPSSVRAITPMPTSTDSMSCD